MITLWDRQELKAFSSMRYENHLQILKLLKHLESMSRYCPSHSDRSSSSFSSSLQALPSGPSRPTSRVLIHPRLPEVEIHSCPIFFLQSRGFLWLDLPFPLAVDTLPTILVICTDTNISDILRCSVKHRQPLRHSEDLMHRPGPRCWCIIVLKGHVQR